jgi:hypothetical protein
MSAAELTELPIDGAEPAAEALDELLSTPRLHLCLYTPELARGLYDRPEFAELIRQRVLAQRRLQVRLVLPPAHQWRRHHPQLALLIQQLSALELRRLPSDRPQDRPEYGYGYVLADKRNLLMFNDPLRCLGRYYPHGGGLRARDLQTFFDTLWEQAVPDTELRKLGI